MEYVDNKKSREAMGRKLKECRSVIGLSSDKVGKQIGVTGGYIRSIEINLLKNPPNREILRRLAELYQIDENEVYRAYGYSEVSRVVPDIPKTPQTILVDVNQMASSFIPIYDSLDLGAKPVDFYSMGWQNYTQNLRGYLVSDLTYDHIKVVGVVIVELFASPSETQLALYKDGEGNLMIAQGVNSDLHLIGVIRHVCVDI